MGELTLKGQTDEITRLIAAGSLSAAASMCRRLLASFPRYVGAYSLYAQVFLAMGRLQTANDLFGRVLSVDPEHIVAYQGLARISEQADRLDEAIGYLRCALDLAPSSQAVRSSLFQLYQARDGEAPQRLKLTAAGLAWAYLRGQLYDRAGAILCDLLSVNPSRLDLSVALIETLWLSGAGEEAAREAEGVLQRAPYCLKARLVAGQVWLGGPRDQEARDCLRVAQDLDPENATAQALFGRLSPLPLRTQRLTAPSRDLAPLDLPYLQQAAEDTGDEPEAAVPATPPPTSASVGEDQPAESAPTTRGLALIDVRRAYVEEHMDDARARLDLARQYRDMGRIANALEQYEYLVANEFTVLGEVVRDLALLNRFYPGTPALVETLALARERERLQPPQQ